MNRATVRRLYFALLGGMVMILTVFGFLIATGTAPGLSPDQRPLLGIIFAVMASGPLLVGWFWARPRLIPRQRGQSADEYWKAPEPGARALLLWVLWEGSGLISAVGTLLSVSPLALATALAALALFITHGPGFIENREAS